MLTSFEGDVKVNDLSISQKTELNSGYKISVSNDSDSFAVLTYTDGNRVLIKSGELIIEKKEENNNRLSIKEGEYYLHINNPDKRLIATVMSIKTPQSIINIYGGDSYFNTRDNKLYFACSKGKADYEDPWGQLTIVKGNAILLKDKNIAPKMSPISYNISKKIKLGFDRMGIKYLE